MPHSEICQAEMPRVSVVMPAFNSSGTVADAVGDVLGQTFASLELIYVDDGSTDGTPDVVKDAAAGDERVVLAQQCHSGAAAARNLGLSLARGTRVCFIDSDDRLDSNYLEAMVERMDTDGFDMACCGWDRGNGIEARSFGGKVAYQDSGSLEALLDDDAFFSSLWNKMFDRSLLFPDGAMVSFDESLTIGEDEEWLSRVLQGCRSCSVIDKPLYHWTRREGSLTEDSCCLSKTALSEVRAKERVYHNLSQERRLGLVARRRYLALMRNFLVEAYSSGSTAFEWFDQLLAKARFSAEAPGGSHRKEDPVCLLAHSAWRSWVACEEG